MAEEKKAVTEKGKLSPQNKNGAGTSRFFKETVIELKKVVWPTKKQLAIYTAVVIIASILMAFLISGADWIFGKVDELYLLKK